MERVCSIATTAFTNSETTPQTTPTSVPTEPSTSTTEGQLSTAETTSIAIACITLIFVIVVLILCAVNLAVLTGIKRELAIITKQNHAGSQSKTPKATKQNSQQHETKLPQTSRSFKKSKLPSPMTIIAGPAAAYEEPISSLTPADYDSVQLESENAYEQVGPTRPTRLQFPDEKETHPLPNLKSQQ